MPAVKIELALLRLTTLRDFTLHFAYNRALWLCSFRYLISVSYSVLFLVHATLPHVVTDFRARRKWPIPYTLPFQILPLSPSHVQDVSYQVPARSRRGCYCTDSTYSGRVTTFTTWTNCICACPETFWEQGRLT